MSTLDRLPGGIPIATVRAAKRSQRESKAAQFTGGSSTRTYWSENDVTHDWEGRLNRQSPQSPDLGDVLIEVKFEGTADWVILDYVVELYRSSNGTSWTRCLKDDPWGSPYFSYFVNELPASEDEPRAFYVYVWISALYNSWAALKVLGISNDELTVTVTRVG